MAGRKGGEVRPKRPTAGKEKPGHNVFLVGTMGDTQKSQTISTESQGIATQVAHEPIGCSQEQAADKPTGIGR